MANPVPSAWVDAVAADGMAIHWAPEATVADKDVVLAALTQNCIVIRDIHATLQKYISGLEPGLEAARRRLRWAYTLLPSHRGLRRSVAMNLPVDLVEIVGRHTNEGCDGTCNRDTPY
jgi:hypothetical protein